MKETMTRLVNEIETLKKVLYTPDAPSFNMDSLFEVVSDVIQEDIMAEAMYEEINARLEIAVNLLALVGIQQEYNERVEALDREGGKCIDA